MSRILILAFAFVVVVAVSFNTTAMAQEETEPDSRGSAVRLFDHFVVEGGVITWFVLIPLSIATIALVVEHSFSIRRGKLLPVESLHRLQSDVEARRYVDAVKFSSEDPSVFSQAIRNSLLQADNGYPAMQRAMLDSLDQSAGKMMRKIEYLNVIGNVSPMIGLFGTVVGMIGLFASITEAGGIPEPARIADEISVALVTTFWGLMVAIPALSVFAFFRNRIDEITSECAVRGDRLLSAFEPPPASAGTAQRRTFVQQSQLAG